MCSHRFAGGAIWFHSIAYASECSLPKEWTLLFWFFRMDPCLTCLPNGVGFILPLLSLGEVPSQPFAFSYSFVCRKLCHCGGTRVHIVNFGLTSCKISVAFKRRSADHPLSRCLSNQSRNNLLSQRNTIDCSPSLYTNSRCLHVRVARLESDTGKSRRGEPLCSRSKRQVGLLYDPASGPSIQK